MNAAGWAIAVATIVCILIRPLRVNEAWWGAAGALALVAAGGIAPSDALAAVERGSDVYLFLIGMMALAAYADAEGIFAWVAARAVRIAGTSRGRLFALVYVTGIATTALLSNDATIVVLTPAVIDALRRYDAPPFPYVIACALVANAASFVLPISNPSNLLVFAGGMPALTTWLGIFGLPSVAALAVTYAVLWWSYRREFAGPARVAPPRADTVRPAALAVALLVLAAIAVVATSARQGPLGTATFACAAIVWLAAAVRDRAAALRLVRSISVPIVVLTASLFVIITAVDTAGGFAATQRVLAACAHLAAPWSTLATGAIVALASNVVNNLPVGLNLGQTLPAMHAPSAVAHAALIGVNLGPNATVNGSLATLLWLAIVRREGIAASPGAYARVAVVVTVPALLAALLALRGSW